MPFHVSFLLYTTGSSLSSNCKLSQRQEISSRSIKPKKKKNSPKTTTSQPRRLWHTTKVDSTLHSKVSSREKTFRRCDCNNFISFIIIYNIIICKIKYKMYSIKQYDCSICVLIVYFFLWSDSQLLFSLHTYVWLSRIIFIV